MYFLVGDEDLADLKTKIDSTDEAEMKSIMAKIKIQDAKINSNSKDIKNVFNITKSSINQIEQLNTEIDELKNKDDDREFISSVTKNEVTIGYHIIAGSYASKENAEKQLKDLSPKAISSAVKKEALQKPLTSYCLALSVLGMSYVALFGLSGLIITGALALGFIAAGNWMYEAFVKGNQNAAAEAAL